MKPVLSIMLVAVGVLSSPSAGSAAQLPQSPTAIDAPTHRREPGMSAQSARVYAQTAEMMRRSETPGTAARMLAMLTPAVRAQRHPLLVGRLVVAAAALASDVGGQQEVERLINVARNNPGDHVAAFVAGVAVHYRGHVRAVTRAEKTADYKQAIALLEPLKETFADSPRLWIYLAVSYLRTDRQRDAEAAIDRAVAVDSGSDADVYYCRAEVHHRKDPMRAVADIDRYIAIMAKNKRRGAFSASGKETKVAWMRKHLIDVAKGRAKSGGIELFDPIRDPVPSASITAKSPYFWAWIALGFAGLLVAVGWARRWARRKR